MTREEAKEQLECIYTEVSTETDRCAIDVAIEALKEPKQGEWIYNKGDIEVGVPPTNECSECGHYIDELLYPNFCPNCGARMKEGDEK